MLVLKCRILAGFSNDWQNSEKIRFQAGANMARRQWKHSYHLIELEHSWISGRAELTVDGVTVFNRGDNSMDFGFAHRFDIDDKPCAVKVFSSGFGFRYEFVTGDAAEAVEESNKMPVNWTKDILLGTLVGVPGGLAVGYGILLAIRKLVF
ncbi:MAG: hypothetical protein KDA68_23515 [Planctomycetaceae bacterium]|nr:hypothetical protein [Planctomycetaceae bacterium]